jgi:hypothetical protein
MCNAHVASIVGREDQLVPEAPKEEARQTKPRILQKVNEEAEE